MAYVITEHMPLESWWTAGDFYARQKQEQPRMQLSRYGQQEQLMYGPEGPKRQKPRASLVDAI